MWTDYLDTKTGRHIKEFGVVDGREGAYLIVNHFQSGTWGCVHEQQVTLAGSA